MSPLSCLSLRHRVDAAQSMLERTDFRWAVRVQPPLAKLKTVARQKNGKNIKGTTVEFAVRATYSQFWRSL